MVNRKRVQRLWREEGLRVPAAPPKRQRVGSSTVPAHRLRATRINQVWALDFLFDATSDGRPIKALAMCDEWSRESIGRELGRSITAEDAVRILDQAKAVRGAPEHVRMDNGPEFIAEAIRGARPPPLGPGTRSAAPETQTPGTLTGRGPGNGLRSLGEAYSAVKEWATANGVELSDVSWEEYTNDPGEVLPEEYRTQVYWPLR